MQVEAVSEQVRVQLEGRWVWPTVILCEAVRLRAGSKEVEVTDKGCLPPPGCLVHPGGETSGEPVRRPRPSSTKTTSSWVGPGCGPRRAGGPHPSPAFGRSGCRRWTRCCRNCGWAVSPCCTARPSRSPWGGAAPGHSVAWSPKRVPANTGLAMQDREYAARIEAVAACPWPVDEILASLGVDERILKRRNLPCPLCGGTDRFQYTDKFGEGTTTAASAARVAASKLLQAVMGVDFNTALRDVERCLGMMPVTAPSRSCEPSAERMKKLAQRIWNEAKPVTVGDGSIAT